MGLACQVLRVLLPRVPRSTPCRKENVAQTLTNVARLVHCEPPACQVTRTIEGRERYPVIVRYERARCQDLSNLERVLVKRRRRKSRWRSSRRSLLSPRSAMVGDENGQLAGYIYVDSVAAWWATFALYGVAVQTASSWS